MTALHVAAPLFAVALVLFTLLVRWERDAREMERGADRVVR